MDDLFYQDFVPQAFERIRSHSIRSFEQSIIEPTVRVMLEELNKLRTSIQDAKSLKCFDLEIRRFMDLFVRYLHENASGTQVINWDEIKLPTNDEITLYSTLCEPEPHEHPQLLSKLAVIKLNGGLGTTMGCVGPKSVIEVRDNLTFLDLTFLQLEHLQKTHNVQVPLYLMNSFNTKDETERIIRKYSSNVKIETFTQSRFPRIFKDSLLPCPKSADESSPKSGWYPPGHGDIFNTLNDTGILDKLIEEGKEWIFLSNIDNLGATIDFRILKHLNDTGSEFFMEVTDKTKADVKGGTLIKYQDRVRLLEIAQVSAAHIDDFKSIRKFKIFNTNNLWISTKAIKRLINDLTLDIIANIKRLDTGEKIIQLETAVGTSIKYFSKAHGINVPRSRFLPVKNTSDLFLVMSDLYRLDHGHLILNKPAHQNIFPIIKLGESFMKVAAFLNRFKGPPKILELDHLTVTGDVTFGSDVTLKGTVIIVASDGCRIDIPAGSILEDKVVTGHLRIMDH